MCSGTQPKLFGGAQPLGSGGNFQAPITYQGGTPQNFDAGDPSNFPKLAPPQPPMPQPPRDGPGSEMRRGPFFRYPGFGGDDGEFGRGGGLPISRRLLFQ